MIEKYTTSDYVAFHKVLEAVLNQLEDHGEDFGVAEFELGGDLNVKLQVTLSMNN